jgi:hypothetical protein
VHTFTPAFGNHDYKIEAEIEHASGGDDKGNGLVIGADDLLQNYYRFLFSKNGAFLIEKITGKTKTVIQNWKYSAALREKAANNLSVVKFGDHWSFRINDVVVYSGDAMSFFGNRHGFYISSHSHIYSNSFRIYDITLAKTDNKTPKENIYDAVFLDYFTNNNNDWVIEDNDDIKTSISNTYIMQNKSESNYMIWQQMPISDIMNHRIEIKTSHENGVEDHAYGICFGVKDANNTYMFSIAADGHFIVGKFVDGDFEAIKSWTETDAVYTSSLATNTLAFEKTDKWYFYINGKLVYSCEPHTYFGNRFGFYVEDKQTIAFRSIKLSGVTHF